MKTVKIGFNVFHAVQIEQDRPKTAMRERERESDQGGHSLVILAFALVYKGGHSFGWFDEAVKFRAKRGKFFAGYSIFE